MGQRVAQPPVVPGFQERRDVPAAWGARELPDARVCPGVAVEPMGQRVAQPQGDPRQGALRPVVSRAFPEQGWDRPGVPACPGVRDVPARGEVPAKPASQRQVQGGFRGSRAVRAGLGSDRGHRACRGDPDDRAGRWVFRGFARREVPAAAHDPCPVYCPAPYRWDGCGHFPRPPHAPFRDAPCGHARRIHGCPPRRRHARPDGFPRCGGRGTGCGYPREVRASSRPPRCRDHGSRVKGAARGSTQHPCAARRPEARFR